MYQTSGAKVDPRNRMSADQVRIYIYIEEPAEIRSSSSLTRVRIHIYIALEKVRIYIYNRSGFASTSAWNSN
eukprot:733150-Amphidinium_carterae.1